MRVNIADRLKPHFPLGGELFELQLVEEGTPTPDDDQEPRAYAVIRSVRWELNEDAQTMSIRDVKEQEIFMGWPALYDDTERVANFFGALGDVIKTIAEGNLEQLDYLMPHDLLCTDALKLKRAQTREDFAKALCAKSRLGAYLPTPPVSDSE